MLFGCWFVMMVGLGCWFVVMVGYGLRYFVDGGFTVVLNILGSLVLSGGL